MKIKQILLESLLFGDYRTNKENYSAGFLKTQKVDSDNKLISGTENLWKYVVLFDTGKRHSLSYELKKENKDLSVYVYASIDINHNNKTVNLFPDDAKSDLTRRPNPKNDKVSYFIPDATESLVSDIKKLQDLLLVVIKKDPEVLNFKIVGSTTIKDITVKDLLSKKETNNVAAHTGGKLILFHGTSEKRAKEILKGGLRPGKQTEEYYDLIPGYSNQNIYLTSSQSTARNYASRAAIFDKSKAVVLAVEVNDFTKFVPDEDNMNWFMNSGMSESFLNKVDSVFKSEYPNYFKSDDYTIASSHLKNLLLLPNFVNSQTFKMIIVGYSAFIAKHLRKGSTIAYKGSIPANKIKKIEEYKPAKMPKAPSQEEFDDAKEKTELTRKFF